MAAHDIIKLHAHIVGGIKLTAITTICAYLDNGCVQSITE